MLRFLGLKSAVLAGSLGFLTFLGLGYTFYPSSCADGGFLVSLAQASDSCHAGNLMENDPAGRASAGLSLQGMIEAGDVPESNGQQLSTEPAASDIAATANDSASVRPFAGSSVVFGKRSAKNNVGINSGPDLAAADEVPPATPDGSQRFTVTGENANASASAGGQVSFFGVGSGGSSAGGGATGGGDQGTDSEEASTDTDNEQAVDVGDENTGDTGDEDATGTGDENTGDTGDGDTTGTGDENTGDAGDGDATDTGDENAGDTGDEDAGDSGDVGTGSGDNEAGGSDGDEPGGSDEGGTGQDSGNGHGSGNGHDSGSGYGGGYDGGQNASVPEIDSSSVGIALGLMLSLVAFIRERRKHLPVRSR